MSIYSAEGPEFEQEDETVMDAMPKEGNFVLVQFDSHNKKVFYIGKVIGGQGNEIVVSYLRRSLKILNGFRLPGVADR